MMKISDFLEMKIGELEQSIPETLISNPSKGAEIVEGLVNSKRYEREHDFRLVVDIGRAILHNVRGEFHEIVPLAKDIIERATTYRMWEQCSLGLNAIGNAYFGLEIYEAALEYYYKIIDNELKHGLNKMISVAYNNMGLIYGRVKSTDKAYEYISEALRFWEIIGKNNPMYSKKKIEYLSNMVMVLCAGERVDKVKPYLDELESMDVKNEGQIIQYSYLIAKMYYSFFTKDFELGKKMYFEAKENILAEGIIRQLSLLVGYGLLCEKMELGYDFYIDEFIEIEGKEEIRGLPYSHQFYDILRRYYKKVGNKEKYGDISELYIDSVRMEIESAEKQQAENLNIVESLVKKNIDIESVSGQNLELKRMTNEALENKSELEKAYRKIEIINELGRQVTATTDLPTVVEMIYNKLKQNLPLDIFVIMVPDEEGQSLVSLNSYAFDKPLEKAVIPFDIEESIFVHCFKTGKTLLSWIDEEGERFKKQHENEDRPSAIFIPLKVNQKTIGVCSVQYKSAGAYTEQQLKFLEEAAPYLSIALNNAMRSMELEKEIKSHLETQKKLQEVNRSLQKMSTIDGLTEIHQRRIFEEKILEILTEAGAKKKSVSVLMIDIDSFKLYNDTYGHLEGDVVLKKVAKVFSEVMEQHNGIAARFGGEEFIGALSGYSVEEGYGLGEKIRQGVEDLQIPHSSSKTGVLTVSVGISLCDTVDVSMKSELMRVADESLYKAKNNGKNQVVITEI